MWTSSDPDVAPVASSSLTTRTATVTARRAGAAAASPGHEPVAASKVVMVP